MPMPLPTSSEAEGTTPLPPFITSLTSGHGDATTITSITTAGASSKEEEKGPQKTTGSSETISITTESPIVRGSNGDEPGITPPATVPANSSPVSSASDRGVINPNILSWVFLAWLDRIMLLGYKRPLEIKDLPLLNPRDQTGVLSKLIVPYWEKLRAYLKNPEESKKPNLLKFLISRFIVNWILSGIFLAISTGSQVAVPTFIQQIIYYLQPEFPKSNLIVNNGIAIAFIIFGLQLLFTIFGRTHNQINRTIMVNLRTVLIGAIYEKSLRLSNEAQQTFTQGNILNLINVDTETLAEFMLESHTIIVTPIQVVVTLYLLYKLLGNAVWAALGVLLGSLIIQASLFSFVAGIQKSLLSSSDARLKLIREMLYGIKVIKFRAWEPIFQTRVSHLRSRQLESLKRFNIILVVFICMAQLTPILMPIVAFIAYARGRPEVGLDPAIIFPALALFQLLIGPLFILPTIFSSFVRSIVSWNRVSAFLRATESETLTISNLSTTTIPPTTAIEVINDTFRWQRAETDDSKKAAMDKKKKSGELGNEKTGDRDVEVLEGKAEEEGGKKAGWFGKKGKKEKEELEPLPPFIKDLNLSIPRGKLTCVVGPVGSGKSSLLNALIGEMTRLSGTITFTGRIAYVPQQPWILTDTVEGNILFGSELDREKLGKAVRVAALEQDLERLPAGIRTQIGEKGVNISGGQKSRVSLARAVYDDAEIYLLDDPISALDAHVGQTVFQNCIMEALSTKTRILVTHQLHLLPHSDNVIVMDQGRITEIGGYVELMRTEGSRLAGLMKDYQMQSAGERDSKEKDETSTTTTMKEKEKEEVGKRVDDESSDVDLMAEEDRTKGSLKKHVWLSFYRAAGGFWMVLFILVAAVLQQGLGLVTSLWLAWWSSNRFGFSQDTYLTYYGVLGGSQAFAMLCLNGLVVLGAFLASLYYHKAVMKRLLRAPLSFFESQPIGRILNRFSKDIDAVDQQIWIFYFFVIFSGGSLLSTFSLIAYVAPMLLFLVVPLFVIYYFILRFYRATVRELKRLDSNERSPLYAHISETLSGVSSVRAFMVEDKFIAKQRRLLDFSNSPSYLYSCTSIWVSLRIEFIAALIILALGLLGVSSAINPALIGLSLSYALGVVEDIGFLLKSLANLESEMNAVERLDTYANDLPQEAPDHLLTDPKKEDWPSDGRIVIRDLEVRYPSRPDHAVLKDLSIEILPGEKIGVVGRTGSGKSTLLTTLFRLIEPCSGSITIDGQDITRMGLSLLRSSIGIITQEPVLFSGTFRLNLDVENLFGDDEVWEVLGMVGMKEYVGGLPLKLEDPVTENGENLSVGQRQLICLARAILYRSRILLLDEATASVDQAADTLIQQSIRTHFSTATVISIAHRLNTVVGLDRVLVLEDGKAVEFDRPAVLLDREDSALRRLAEVTGEANLGLLREIAEGKK
ncbi:Multidrug resistance-associated protein 1 [Dinochytrium kinnereticum]|nr:Multidrug resistance-associated protein 1 [Dinochytrium kinnereticum]